MDCNDPCDILIEKRCTRCEQWKNADTGFRPGNNVCRLCRNAMVKQWTASNSLRREIIRTKARRSAYIKRMAKRQKTDETNDDGTNDTPVADPAMQTTTDDEQVERV